MLSAKAWAQNALQAITEPVKWLYNTVFISGLSLCCLYGI